MTDIAPEPEDTEGELHDDGAGPDPEDQAAEPPEPAEPGEPGLPF